MGGRLTSLDGLRGVAAIGVYLSHVGMVQNDELFHHGYVAVDLFFLLSGYVIGAAYEHRFAEGLTPVAYLGIRLKRLYPMVAASAVAGLVAAQFRHLEINVWVAFFAQLAFVPLVTQSRQLFPLNGPQWSLWFELFINLVHVLVWRRLTTPLLAMVAGVSSVLLLWVDRHYGYIGVGFFRDDFALGFIRVTAPFSLGLLVFRLRDKIPRLRIPYPLTLAVCALVLGAPKMFQDIYVALLIWPALLIAALGATPTGAIRRIAEVSGLISYPLYAIHLPLLYIGASLIGMAHDPAAPAIGWPLLVVGVPVIAWGLARWVEQPMMRRTRPAGAAA